MILDELLVALGFDYDDDEVRTFSQDIQETVSVVGNLIKASLAVATAVTAFTTIVTKGTDEQGKFANEIGENVGTIDALQYAMQIAGGTADSMNSSLRTLTSRASEAARGVGSGVEAFGMLGISAANSDGSVKRSSDLLVEISQAFQGIDRARQLDLAEKLGVSSSLRLLQQGPEAIRNLTEEAKLFGVTTDEDAESAAAFQDNLVDLRAIMSEISRVITRHLLPVMQEITQAIADWWKENKAVIDQDLPEWIDKITFAMKLMVGATAAWIGLRLITHLFTLIAAFRALSLATLTATAAALVLPLLIGAAVAALALLAEDAKVFFEGGDSCIGEMIGKYPEWTEQLNTVAAVFGTLYDLTKMIWDGWVGIFDLFTSTTLEDIGDVFDNIPGFIKDVGVQMGLPDNMSDIMGDIGSKIGITGSPDISIPDTDFDFGYQGFFDDAYKSASEGVSNFIDRMEIIVNGGTDNAEEVAKSVHDIFQQTSEDLNSSVYQ